MSELVKAIDGLKTQIGDIKKSSDEAVETLTKRLDEADKIQAPNIIKGSAGGGTLNSSRPFSLGRLAVALTLKKSNDSNWSAYAKPELDLCDRVAKAYARHNGYNGGLMIPLSSALMPVQDMRTDDGVTLPGFEEELVKECRDVFECSMEKYDYDEHSRVAKDLTANNATTGGTFIAPAMQGELINELLARQVFGGLPVTNVPLPQQGKITYPRTTTGVTIAAYAEAGTITESTPSTGNVSLEAKSYRGLVDLHEEFLKFATSVGGEAWLRGEFMKELTRKPDRDIINGAGGTSIQGLINYSGVRLTTATTTGAQGDTLDAEDPLLLFADIADQNAPTDGNDFFYAMTNTLWAGLQTRQDSQGRPMFNVFAQAMGSASGVQMYLNGHRVVTSTQVPTDRLKGAATDLTLLLAGVASELMIGRAGAIDIKVTDSDASKFQTAISTMRGTMWCDAAPKHEQSFGYTDDLLNS